MLAAWDSESRDRDSLCRDRRLASWFDVWTISRTILTVVRIMTTIVATSRNKANDQLIIALMIVLEVSNSNHTTCHPTRTYTFRGVSKIGHGIGQEWEKLSSS